MAEENGAVPFLVWLLIVLALGAFAAFIVWWYRRQLAARETPEPTRAPLQEIELTVPPSAELEQKAQPAPGPITIPGPAELQAVEVNVAPEPAEQTAPAVAPQPDDLVRIEGIGPKIASLLSTAGITTFNQLAATPASRLREVLAAANLRFIDPTTWPEQAALAAAGEWAAFEALTQQLRGGRRV